MVVELGEIEHRSGEIQFGGGGFESASREPPQPRLVFEVADNGFNGRGSTLVAFGVLGLAHPVPHRIERIKPLRSRPISRVRRSFGEDLATLAGGNQSICPGRCR